MKARLNDVAGWDHPGQLTGKESFCGTYLAGSLMVGLLGDERIAFVNMSPVRKLEDHGVNNM